jgi:hypothetical protein
MPQLGVAVSIIAAKSDRVGCVGAAETDLLIVRLPPNILRNVGDTIRIVAAFFMAANANSKTDKVYFGNTQVIGRTAAESGLPRMDEVWVTKRANGQQSACGLNHDNGQGSLVTLTDLNESDLNSIQIRMTGQSTQSDDVISRFLIVEYIPAISVMGF